MKIIEKRIITSKIKHYKFIITKKRCSIIFLLNLIYIYFNFSSIINIRYFSKENIEIKNKLLSKFVHYSQDFEDFILYYLFYDISKGFYIDIGANDPNFFSVTKAFYKIGWSGINIEPLPNKFRLLKKFRQRDINLQIGAGNKEGNATLLVKGLRSSLFYNKNQNNSNLIHIKIKPMSAICKKFVPKRKRIEFCKIDVEKSEKNVLLGFDFINYRPKVFCIESLTNKKTKVSESEKWEYILVNNNYEFAYKFRRNRFYFDKNLYNFNKKFYHIEKYIKIYKKNLAKKKHINNSSLN